MYINKKSPIPVYYQLKNIIMQKIDLGEFQPGDPIPSERDLSDTLNISRMTVRQALSQLVTEGVLFREKGKGTFVSKPKIEQRNVMSFSDIVRKKGLVPSTRVLNFQKAIVTEDIKESLQLKSNEPVYNLKRLRLANNTPIGIEEAFIPEKYCPHLERYDVTGSLYKLMQDEYSHTIGYIDSVIESSPPGKDERQLLNISTNIPALRINGTHFTTTGVCLFFEKSVYRSDEYKYNVRVYLNKEI